MALNATIDLTVKKPDFKSMKSEIKELTIAAQQAVMQFGEFSPEAQKAEKALAQAKDRMEDFNDRVKAVNPDKFSKINTVVQGVARGFQAAQGAMALFGNKSEDLEKTMVKLQGAMALADGLEGLGKIQQQFGALAADIKGGVMKAFKSLGNMSTLAFGAIGVVLTLIIANFDTLKKAVMSLIPGLSSMVDFVGGLVQQFTDWVGITSAQDRALEKLNKTTAKSNEQLDREIALLQARGDQVGVFSKQREKLNNDLAQARANYGKNTEKEWGKIILDTKNALKILEVEEGKYHTTQAQAQSTANKESKAKRDARIAQELKDEQERQAKLAALEQGLVESNRDRRLSMAKTDEETRKIAYQNERLALRDKYFKDVVEFAGNEEALKVIRAKYKSDLTIAENNFNKEEEERLKNQNNKTKEQQAEGIKNLQKNAQDKKDINKKSKDDEALHQQQMQDLVVDSLMTTIGMLSALNTQHDNLSEAAAKKSFERQKALGIAEALISTYFTAQKAYESQFKPADTSSPIRGTIAAAIAIAQGLAKVAIIRNKTYTSKSGGAAPSGGGGQISGGGMPQMSAPNISSTLPSVSGFDTKVFVTEGDIRRTTDRVDSTRKVSVVK